LSNRRDRYQSHPYSYRPRPSIYPLRPMSNPDSPFEPIQGRILPDSASLPLPLVQEPHEHLDRGSGVSTDTRWSHINEVAHAPELGRTAERSAGKEGTFSIQHDEDDHRQGQGHHGCEELPSLQSVPLAHVPLPVDFRLRNRTPPGPGRSGGKPQSWALQTAEFTRHPSSEAGPSRLRPPGAARARSQPESAPCPKPSRD
jgi:hypothetical protein